MSFHHLGFWTDRLASRSTRLAVRGNRGGEDKEPRRFTLQRSSYGFYVELFDIAAPRHADLLPNRTSERTNDENDWRSAPSD